TTLTFRGSDPMRPTLAELEQRDDFIRRHIGPDDAEIRDMLRAVGAESLDALTERAIPAAIREKNPPATGDAMPEHAALAALAAMAGENRVCRSLIGLGYHDTVLPNVI